LRRFLKKKRFFIIDQSSISQLSSAKRTIKEYNLETSQLAFTIGKKIDIYQTFPFIPYIQTTIYSEEMIEIFRRESDGDNESVEPSIASTNLSTSSNCSMYKYVPRCGYTIGNEEVLIVYNNKLKVKKYGG